LEDKSGIIWNKQGSTGILSLSPSGGNYLDDPEFANVNRLKEIFSDPDLKGMIIRGSGRHFSAGANLKKLRQLARDESLLKEKMVAGKELITLVNSAPIPVIAAINGACFGGGLEIALACHIRICSESALFAFPETHHGIMPGLGGTVTLAQVIGTGRSTEMILAGDVVNAKKALEMKLVDYVIPAVELDDFTISYIQKLTNDREIDVIRSVMQSIYNSQHMTMDKALEEETKMFCALAVKNYRMK
jgi:enoyl-CoA hydratase